ncbi:MAG: hypothetical protein GX100_13685 [candidate division WS1 bacterium]|nr:hypothetical protein [candidate division WS1 bacterium]
MSDDFENLAADSASPPDTSGTQITVFALVVSVFLFFRKFAGLIKEHLLARFFGAGPATDAYKIIYNSIVYNLYSDAEQLLRPTYLPEFIRQKETDERQAWRLTGTVATLEVVLLTIVAALLMIFARPLIRAVWPALAANPEAYELAVLMLWLMSPALIIFSLSLMPELTLHAYKRFTLPAIAEATYNLMIMVVLFVGVELIWHPGHPRGIIAAALGVIAGGLLRLGVQIPGLWHKLHLLRPSLAIRRTPGVLSMLRLMPPIVMGLTVSMARPIVDSSVCTALGPGMYAALDFGRKLSDAGIMILPLAVSLVVYPYVSEWAAEGNRQRLTDSLVSMTRALAFLFVPLSLGMILMARSLVDLVYNYQEFQEADVRKVTIALICYASGLFIYSVEGSLNKWYFALKDTWTPNWVGVLWALGHLTFSVVGGLYTQLGLVAVALALPLSKGGKVLTLYWKLRRRLAPVPVREVGLFAGRLLAAAAVMGLTVWWLNGMAEPVLQAWQPPVGGKVVQLLALVALVGGVGAVVYLSMAALLRLEEVGQVWSWFRKKLRRR